jgi:hypothetical protein
MLFFGSKPISTSKSMLQEKNKILFECPPQGDSPRTVKVTQVFETQDETQFATFTYGKDI